MALDNAISIEFTEAEIQQIMAAVATIESVFAGKVVNLTPEQRKLHGRVRYDMEVWVQKVHTYMNQNPQWIPRFVNKAEHDKDMKAHNQLNPILSKLETLYRAVEDTNILLGSDIYVNSMAFYRSVKLEASGNTAGAGAVHLDLSQQFPGGRKPGNGSGDSSKSS